MGTFFRPKFHQCFLWSDLRHRRQLCQCIDVALIDEQRWHLTSFAKIAIHNLAHLTILTHYTAFWSPLQWLSQGTFNRLEKSSLGPSRSCASLPNESRNVKKTVCLPSSLSFPPAISPDCVMDNLCDRWILSNCMGLIHGSSIPLEVLHHQSAPELLEHTPILTENSSNIRILFCCCLAERNESNLLVYICAQVFFRMPSSEAAKLCPKEQLRQDLVHLGHNVLPFWSPFFVFQMTRILNHMIWLHGSWSISVRARESLFLCANLVPVSRVQWSTFGECTLDPESSLYASIPRMLFGMLCRLSVRESWVSSTGFPVLWTLGVNTTGSGSFFNNEVLGL